MKILVIEDNEADQILIDVHLRKVAPQTLQIHFAKTLDEGDDALFHWKFDLVFLDFFLPDSRSVDDIVSFLKTHAKEKIVMLTADEDEKTIFQCMQAGALDFLMKPVLRDNELRRILLYAEHRTPS